MKDGLDRIGMEIQIKTAKISCIEMCPQMHFLDLQQMDHWLNGCLRAAGSTVAPIQDQALQQVQANLPVRS